MYQGRISQPHQLSYSSVTSYLSNTPEYSQYNQYSSKDLQEKQCENQNRTSVKLEQNSDLAFLRNTVGSNTASQHSFLRVNDLKKTNSYLRRTVQVNSNAKQYVKAPSPWVQKEQRKTQSINQDQKSKKTNLEENRKDRLQKIMNKYQKKNETKEALKLLQQLKQLKKKQQELRKQRKNQSTKDTEQKTKNTTNNYEFNSPINFSKKNKVNYYTPTYENKSLSTNANSPQNESYYQVEAHQPSKQETKYQKSTNQSSISTILDNPFLASNSKKSTTNLALYSEKQSDFKPIKTHQRQQKKYCLSFSTVTESKCQKQYKPLSSYKPEGFSYSIYSNNSSHISNKTGQVFSKKHCYKQHQFDLPFLSTSSESYKDQKFDRYNFSSSTSNQCNDSYFSKKLNISDFTLGKTLGEGKFGTVHQAIHKKNKSIYALKKIPKSVIKSHWMVDQFLLEVKLQHFCNHPYILSLHGYFDDSENVYLLLEYMQEGTLFLHLKKNATINEKQAATKIKQIASAVQYLHENGIAHRDIKPQNIVMSHGVCKLCDFGWATICDQRRKTYCGTFDYAAPQILEGEEYDMSVDLWCLGILAYEILVGKAPFYHISRKQTMKKIMNCQNQKINYPHSMSVTARSFIQQLLKRNPLQRLKSQDLLKHPFILLADK